MRKLSKLLLSVGVAISLVTPVFATPSEGQGENTEGLAYITQQEQLKKIYHQQLDKGSVESDEDYNIIIKVVDQFGNVMGINTNRYRSTDAINPFFIEAYNEEVTIPHTISRPYYYGKIVCDITSSKEDIINTITLTPTKIMNTVIGNIEFEENQSIDNIWIQVISPDIAKYNQDAIIKIQQDGSFKIHNLMDGTYEFKPFVWNDKEEIDNTWSNKEVFKPMEVVIEGDTVVKVNLENQINFGPIYFEDIDRSNTEAFAIHTPSSLPPQLIQDMAKKLKSKVTRKTDLEKIGEIINAMNNPAVVRYGKLRHGTLHDIIRDGKIYYESCGDYANVFVSLCRELDIPAIYAQAASIGTDYSEVKDLEDGRITAAEAHQNVEVYLTDEQKWVLVEPHFKMVIEDYDVLNPYVAYTGKDLNLPKDGVYYFYIKSAENTFSKPHEFVLSNIDTSLSITPQTYSVKFK